MWSPSSSNSADRSSQIVEECRRRDGQWQKEHCEHNPREDIDTVVGCPMLLSCQVQRGRNQRIHRPGSRSVKRLCEPGAGGANANESQDYAAPKAGDEGDKT